MRKLLEQWSQADWAVWVLLTAFILTTSLFAFQVFRILTMKREKREHAAHLPLQADDEEVSVRAKSHEK
jgi:hypothetical protein